MALLPALAAERVREPGLASLLARPTMVRTVCLIRHLDYSLSPVADALIGAIRDYLKTAEAHRRRSRACRSVSMME